MSNLKESITVAFAFVGVVVGAGFATGQEIFQFFTSNGRYSVLGVIITGLIITIAGVLVLNTGYRLRSHSHTEPIKYYLPRTIATIFDIILTLFLRSEEHTSELQSRFDLVCRLLLEKKQQY